MKKMIMNSLGSITELEFDEEFTIRDYFAAKAMVALTQRRHPYEILEEEYTKDIYKAAYKMADAMMEARK